MKIDSLNKFFDGDKLETWESDIQTELNELTEFRTAIQNYKTEYYKYYPLLKDYVSLDDVKEKFFDYSDSIMCKFHPEEIGSYANSDEFLGSDSFVLSQAICSRLDNGDHFFYLDINTAIKTILPVWIISDLSYGRFADDINNVSTDEYELMLCLGAYVIDSDLKTKDKLSLINNIMPYHSMFSYSLSTLNDAISAVISDNFNKSVFEREFPGDNFDRYKKEHLAWAVQRLILI